MSILSTLRSRLTGTDEAVTPNRHDKHRLAEKLTNARQAADHWKLVADQYRRQVLSTEVIKHVLERRVPMLPARMAVPPPADREAVLRSASAAYEEAVAAGPAEFSDRIHRMQVQGLKWSMPIMKPREGGPRDAWLVKQRFPYRAIAQTRELAVGGIMLDLGANLGRMSVPRVVLGDVLASYCAEPDPLNYACLVSNAVDNGLNGYVLPDRVAIGDREGTVILRRGRAYGAHRVLPDSATLLPGHDRVEVPSVTVDAWLRRLRVNPDAINFVKVDVQGYEVRVLRGAADLLTRRHIAWQLEVDPAHLEAAGSSLQELIDVLVQHFEQFIDMSGHLGGPRERPISELREGLGYLGDDHSNTDLLLF